VSKVPAGRVREKPAEAPSGLSIPAFGYPVGPERWQGRPDRNHFMDFVTRKKSPMVTLIEFQRHVALGQHALTFGR
jgi:hypothetical protein